MAWKGISDQISRKILTSECWRADDTARMAAHIDYRSAASRCVPKLFSPRQPVNSEVELFHPLYRPAGRANLQVAATSFRSRAATKIVHLWCREMCIAFFFQFSCRAIMYVQVFDDLLRNIYFTVSSLSYIIMLQIAANNCIFALLSRGNNNIIIYCS